MTDISQPSAMGSRLDPIHAQPPSPERLLGIPPINILTVENVKSRDLAIWLGYCILNIRLPDISAGSAMAPLVAPYLREISNRLGFVTEMYNVVLAGHGLAKVTKKGMSKSLTKDLNLDETVADMEVKVEQLYRTMQTLNRQYEAASRLVTVVDQFNNEMSRR